MLSPLFDVPQRLQPIQNLRIVFVGFILVEFRFKIRCFRSSAELNRIGGDIFGSECLFNHPAFKVETDRKAELIKKCRRDIDELGVIELFSLKHTGPLDHEDSIRMMRSERDFALLHDPFSAEYGKE